MGKKKTGTKKRSAAQGRPKKRKVTKSKVAKRKRAKASSVATDPTAHLHQVRQLLFGEQIGALEGMLDTMQKKVMRELNVLRRELRAELKASQSDAAKGIADLGRRMDRMRDDQAEVDEKQARRLEASKASLARRIATLEKETGQRLKTVRERITNSSGKFSEQLSEKTSRLRSDFSEELAEVQANAVPREAMAKLFAELSKQVAASESS